MANGTIAFDTLTTSDQAKSGTEKSIDTSYIFNGVAKSWCNYASASSFTINDTFNVTSVTDGGAGAGQPQFTNNMANTKYSLALGSNMDNMKSSGNNSTTEYYITTMNSSHSAADGSLTMGQVEGDLA